MPDKFDPYFKSLGIPPEEQSPSHNQPPDTAGGTLYTRIRGRVSGPYNVEKLRTLARRGQLSRLHELSINGVSWQPAADYPQLFLSSGVVAPVDVSPVAAPILAESETALVVSRDVANPGGMRKAKTKDARKRLHFKLNIIGHIVAPIVGLALGAVILMFMRGSSSHSSPGHVSSGTESEPQPSNPPSTLQSPRAGASAKLAFTWDNVRRVVESGGQKVREYKVNQKRRIEYDAGTLAIQFHAEETSYGIEVSFSPEPQGQLIAADFLKRPFFTSGESRELIQELNRFVSQGAPSTRRPLPEKLIGRFRVQITPGNPDFMTKVSFRFAR